MRVVGNLEEQRTARFELEVELASIVGNMDLHMMRFLVEFSDMLKGHTHASLKTLNPEEVKHHIK